MTKIISRIFGILADVKLPAFLQKRINRAYVAYFKIDMREFASVDSYECLNALFTRGLRKNRDFSREERVLISPCDGFVMENGRVQNGMALQIKGFLYSAEDLVFGREALRKMRDSRRESANLDSRDSRLDSRFDSQDSRDSRADSKHESRESLESFLFINLYLSPKNYHRYHAPCDLWVEEITQFRGALMPVHRKSLRKNANLFVRNERVVLRAKMPSGARLFFVAVGALNVGSMIFYIEPRLQENFRGKSRTFAYKTPHFVKKGDELGMFKMGGSTIVLLIDAREAEILKREEILFGDSLVRF